MEGAYRRNVESLNGATVVFFYETDSEGRFTTNQYWIAKTNTVEEQYYWMGGYFCATDFVLDAPDASGISEKTPLGQGSVRSRRQEVHRQVIPI